VAQGSVLSPSMFNLYSMDLIDEVQKLDDVNILMYADDVCVVAHNKYALDKTIKTVKRWCLLNNM
jgi:hypothetical protein